jgi:hypothetical protein
MDIPIKCPECGTENSSFARFMKLSRCRICGHDLQLVEVSETLHRGGTLQGRSSLYEYVINSKEASFFPRGVLLAPPIKLDIERRVVHLLGDIDADQGMSMLWKRLKGIRENLSFDQVSHVEVEFHLEKLAREDHPYQHHWTIKLHLCDGREIPIGRITAERQFAGPVRSHHHALRLAHALHEIAGWKVESSEKEGDAANGVQGSRPEK